jgi:hypothetical protein
LEGTMGITKKSRQLEELKQKWLKWWKIIVDLFLGKQHDLA